jgi:hypothetical protein
MEDYEYEKYVTNIKNVKKTILKYGVAIIPNVLDEDECEDIKKGMWDMLEYTSENLKVPIKRDDKKTWRSIKEYYGLHSMLIQHWHLGQSEFIWKIRENDKIIKVFEKIWSCEKDDLLVSFDGISINLAPEVTNYGINCKDWLHVDQRFTNNDFSCIQSWVNPYDTNEGDSTLYFLENSNLYHEGFEEKYATKCESDWYKFTDDELEYYKDEKKCEEKRIKCPKGSLVLWDSRTVHCGGKVFKEREEQNTRCAIYLCYIPRKYCTDKDLKKKIKAFDEMRITSHYANRAKLFAKNPRTYGEPLPNIKKIEKPELNETRKKLIGY